MVVFWATSILFSPSLSGSRLILLDSYQPFLKLKAQVDFHLLHTAPPSDLLHNGLTTMIPT